MSLINDALKRVKEAQRQAPPAASLGPQFRPVEPVPAPRHSLGLLLPIGLVGGALLGLLLVWELAEKGNSSGALPVRAQAALEEDSSKPMSQTAGRLSETASPAGVSSREVSSPQHATSSTALPEQLASAAPANSAISAALTNLSVGSHAKPSPATDTAAAKIPGAVEATNAVAQGASTNPPAVAEEPKPAPLKLQGIVFSKRPSAVISGKTLFVGDRIREFRVVAITQDAAMLAGGGRTNVLGFSE